MVTATLGLGGERNAVGRDTKESRGVGWVGKIHQGEIKAVIAAWGLEENPRLIITKGGRGGDVGVPKTGYKHRLIWHRPQVMKSDGTLWDTRHFT